MSDKSNIEWTDASWNPVRGCVKVSPGCKHCYAETFAERFRGVQGHPYEQGFDPRLVPEKLGEPIRWRAARRIFVNSMSDLFQEAVPSDYIAACFGVMALACHHTYQVLTKRGDRLAELMPRLSLNACMDAVLDFPVGPSRAQSRAIRDALPPGSPFAATSTDPLWPLPNVHLGVSVFFPLDPRPEDFMWEDVGAGLVAQARYGGHLPACGPSVLYTVAQHAILALALVAPAFRKPVFHHDDAEGIWGFGDVCGPVKRLPFVAAVLKPIEREVEEAIAKKAGLPIGFPDWPEVKAADRLMLAWEDRDLRGIPHPDAPIPSTPIIPWKPRHALDRWHEWRELLEEGCECSPLTNPRDRCSRQVVRCRARHRGLPVPP